MCPPQFLLLILAFFNDKLLAYTSLVLNDGVDFSSRFFKAVIGVSIKAVDKDKILSKQFHELISMDDKHNEIQFLSLLHSLSYLSRLQMHQQK